MGVYVGGNTGSGDTHVAQVLNGGKKKTSKKAGPIVPVKKATKAQKGR